MIVQFVIAQLLGHVHGSHVQIRHQLQRSLVFPPAMDIGDSPEMSKPRRPIQDLVAKPLDGCRRSVSLTSLWQRPAYLDVRVWNYFWCSGCLSWMYYPGIALSLVDMVSTSAVPFQLVVEGPVQPPGRRGAKFRCSPK